jgi:hypothetical protein
VLVTFTELGAPHDLFTREFHNGADHADGRWHAGAVHCGPAMELVTPAVGPAIGYTFEPEDGGPVQLPPVWRCGCGFQLDAWFYSPYAPDSQDVRSGADHIVALSA